MKATIGIVDYGAGNIYSLTCALERLKIPFTMLHKQSDYSSCTGYIIPGVGHAGAAMQKLVESKSIPLILESKKPVLGICVGMQLLSTHSEEGNSELTGIIPLKTCLFPSSSGLKVPHMGWNQVNQFTCDPLFEGIANNSHFYFVHSYYIEFNPNFTIGSTDYGLNFSAAVHFNQFWGVQFHPERSGENGERILHNFYKLLN